MKRLAIIAARGGSKRIPGKNIRSFCGKPMISYILDAARQSKLFDVVHVSTDSEEIHRVVSDLGFPPEFPRSKELADDFTPIMPVMKYVTEMYKNKGKTFDQIWLLMACAPMITAEDLLGMEKLFMSQQGKHPAIGVGAYASPIERGYRRDDQGRLAALDPEKFPIRTQDLPTAYFDAGAFSVFPSDRVLYSDGAGRNDDFLGYILPKHKAIDVDDEGDWKIAEAIYAGIKQLNL